MKSNSSGRLFLTNLHKELTKFLFWFRNSLTTVSTTARAVYRERTRKGFKKTSQELRDFISSMWQFHCHNPREMTDIPGYTIMFLTKPCKNLPSLNGKTSQKWPTKTDCKKLCKSYHDRIDEKRNVIRYKLGIFTRVFSTWNKQKNKNI